MANAAGDLQLEFDPEMSPEAWVRSLLTVTRGKSGGQVEKHLVGAKLERRYPETTILVHAASAGDTRTAAIGDFVVGSTAYHVTTAPSKPIIDSCVDSLAAGYHPVLLVPEDLVTRTKGMADMKGVADNITILSLEDFVALNIIQMSAGQKSRFLNTLNDILEAYNRRIEEVESDQSLRVQILNLPQKG